MLIFLNRREALGIWKSRLGREATYRALIEVFFRAGRLDYADAVCDILKEISESTRGIKDKHLYHAHRVVSQCAYGATGI